MLLTTARLVLTPTRPDDAEELAAYFRRNHERFARWKQNRPHDVAEHRDAITRNEATGLCHEFLARQPGTSRLLAVVTLSGLSRVETPEAMLGYSVDGSEEGRGIAYEAVSCVLSHAFTQMDLQAVSAYYEPDNVRSGRLLERLGFMVVARVDAIPGFEHLMRAQVVARKTLS